MISQPSAGYIPDFLQDYASMHSHLTDQAIRCDPGKAKAKAKGLFFEKLASEIIAEYPEIDLPIYKARCEFTGGSWEEGIDLIFNDEDDDSWCLYAQVKWSINKVDDFDLILSKFDSFFNKSNLKKAQEEVEQGSLLPLFEMDSDLQESQIEKRIEFVIITLKPDCGKIVTRFCQDERPSKKFYDFLAEKKALHLIDGEQVFNLLKTNLCRLCGILPDVKLKFETPPIRVGNVMLGVVSANTLAECYFKSRESLFFENVRLFKGEDSGKKHTGQNREPVNLEILKTVINEPEKLLSRNNGITFRARNIIFQEGTENSYLLEKASIVNGCQTTYMVAKGIEKLPEAGQSAKVLVKVVETTSSWDVAEAANFQNKINQLDLKLARYLRPQIAIRAGMQTGVNVEYETEPFNLVEKLSSARTSYDDVKVLFLGLFSRSPNNSISTNYTELRYDLLDQFLKKQQEDQQDSILTLIIEIQAKSSDISEKISRKFGEKFSELFKRFIEKGSYKAFLTITAACVLSEKNIYTDDVQLPDIEKLLQDLAGKEKQFLEAYRAAFMTLANKAVSFEKSRDENLKSMHAEVKNAGKSNTFDTLIALASENYRQSQR